MNNKQFSSKMNWCIGTSEKGRFQSNNSSLKFFKYFIESKKHRNRLLGFANKKVRYKHKEIPTLEERLNLIEEVKTPSK